MPKAVLIDVDNTLLDFSKCSKYAMVEMFREMALEYNEDYYTVFHEINDSLWLKMEKALLTREGLYKKRWRMIFERLNIDADSDRAEIFFRYYLGLSSEHVEGALDLLKYLSAKYAVYAASNSRQREQTARLTKAGFMPYLKGIFTSERIGSPKPKKEFFDACLAEMGNIPKEDIIMIGDSLTADIAGGKEYGLQTCYFNFFKTEIPPDISPDYIVNTLSEIKTIL